MKIHGYFLFVRLFMNGRDMELIYRYIYYTYFFFSFFVYYIIDAVLLALPAMSWLTELHSVSNTGGAEITNEKGKSKSPHRVLAAFWC